MIIDKTKIVPAEKMILVEVQEKETETSSGLILAGDEKNTAPVIGTILAVGKNSIYEKGQIVCYRRYSVDQLTFQNGDKEDVVYFLADSDILATLEKNEKPEKDIYRAIKEKQDISLGNKKDEKEIKSK